MTLDGVSLSTGLNGGYQAVNLAITAMGGAAAEGKILLLGYDMKYQGEKSHWHGGHPEKVGEDMYKVTYLKYFRELPRHLPKGVEIINCSNDSRIDCFRRIPVEEALKL